MAVEATYIRMIVRGALAWIAMAIEGFQNSRPVEFAWVILGKFLCGLGTT